MRTWSSSALIERVALSRTERVPESSDFVDPRKRLVEEYRRAAEDLRRDLGDPQTFVTGDGSGGLAVVCGGRRSFSLLEALTGSSVGFAQHPDQHRREHPILLAVDQELGEGAQEIRAEAHTARRMRW
jgi:hypothetical protein